MHVLLLLPVAIAVIFFTRISDTFVGWVFANYLILLPSWPAVKNAIVIPTQLVQVAGTLKRLLVPRFLRSADSLDDDKLKTE